MTLATLTAAAYKWYTDQPTLGLVAQDEAVQWHNLLLLMGGCVMAVLSVIALILVVRRYVRDIVRAQGGSKAAKRVTAVVLSACFAFGVLEGISKSGIIGYSDANAGEGWWLRDNPEDKSYVTNDYVHISFERRIIPDEASVFVDYRPADSTNDSDWVTLVQSTFAAFPNPTNIPFANAVSNSWHVYSDWTPGPSVQTNGILHADWGKSRRDAAERARGLAVGIPVQTRVALDGKSLPNQPSGKSYTARDYVQDGLVAMWDGVENAGWGLHDSATTNWIDLVGGDVLRLVGDYTVRDSGLHFPLTTKGRSKAVGAKRYALDAFTIKVFVWVHAGFAGTGRGDIFSLDEGAGSGVVAYSADYLTPWRSSWWVFGANKTATVVCGEGVMPETATLVCDGEKWTAYHGDKKWSGTYDKKTLAGFVSLGQLRDSLNRPTPEMTIMSLAIYSRALTPDEVAHNARIDRLRFGEDAVATVAAEDAPASDETETETKGTNE